MPDTRCHGAGEQFDDELLAKLNSATNMRKVMKVAKSDGSVAQVENRWPQMKRGGIEGGEGDEGLRKPTEYLRGSPEASGACR